MVGAVGSAQRLRLVQSQRMATTAAARKPAAITSWPSGLDSPVGSAWRRSTPPVYERTVNWAAMRHTAFRNQMAEEFGQVRAEMLAQDHVMSSLGGRTVDQALDSGMYPKQVWAAVCDAFDIPFERR